MEIRSLCVTLASMAEKMTPETSDTPPNFVADVPIAPLTTFELGGTARHLVKIGGISEAREAVRWIHDAGEPVAVLGGGSNIVLADSGFAGTLLQVAGKKVEMRHDGDDVLVTAGAGAVWDAVVEKVVGDGLSGVECLSGIPGRVGATPIQNVGAYGQEVGQVIDRVRAMDLQTLEERILAADECRFAYRASVFKQAPERFLVLDVTFRLRPGGASTVVYGELQRALEYSPSAPPSLKRVREAVLDLRRTKSMVLAPEDPNRRSAGSFFVNPVVTADVLTEVQHRARRSGVLGTHEDVPAHAGDGGRFKLSAAWMIERAGFPRGLRRGAVGISSAHALALVHHGGGTTAELVDLAREIRDGVGRAFGVALRPEPAFLGFENADPLGDPSDAVQSAE